MYALNDLIFQCLNSSVLFNFLQINTSTLSENLQNVAEVVLSQMGNKGCDFCAKEGITHSHPTTSKLKGNSSADSIKRSFNINQ